MSSRCAPSTSPIGPIPGAASTNAPCCAVVAVVRPGLVLLDVQGRIPHPAHRPPGQAAEVDDQVGRDPSDLAIDLFGLEDQGAQRLTVRPVNASSLALRSSRTRS